MTTRKRRPFTDSEKEQIVKLYRDDVRQVDIGRIMGRAQSTIHHLLVELGELPERQTWTPEQLRVQQVAAHYELSAEELEQHILIAQDKVEAATKEVEVERLVEIPAPIVPDEIPWDLLIQLIIKKATRDNTPIPLEVANAQAS